MHSEGIFSRKTKLTANRQGKQQLWVVAELLQTKLELTRVSRTRFLRALAVRRRHCRARFYDQHFTTIVKAAYLLHYK